MEPETARAFDIASDVSTGGHSWVRAHPTSTVVGLGSWDSQRLEVFLENGTGCMYVLCESKKIPPEDLWQFSQNGWEFFNQILLAYYATTQRSFRSMVDILSI